MSVQPLDLQTLFMQMVQVGKQQAIAKEAVHLAQSMQGTQLVQRSEQQSRSVNETREIHGGPDPIKDGKSGAEAEAQKREEEDQEEKKRQKPDRRFFTDPTLGTKIDITG